MNNGALVQHDEAVYDWHFQFHFVNLKWAYIKSPPVLKAWSVLTDNII